MPPQAPSPTQEDPARTILEGLSGVPDTVKALAHDTYWQTADRQTFETRLGALPIPDKAKADLWDAKYHITRTPIPGATPPLPKWKQYADMVLDQLPYLGGAAGGITGGIAGTTAGGPVGGFFGGVGGATAGGATGEAIREYGKTKLGTMPAPKTTREALTNIGEEGAIQGALEAGGLGIMAGGARLGRSLVGAGVRPGQDLLKGFHDILDTIIAERVPVGQSGRMAALRKESAGVLKRILQRAEAAGTEFQATAVGRELIPLIQSLRNQPVSAKDSSRLYGLVTEFLNKHRNPITPTALKALKQSAQRQAGSVFKASEKGLAIPTEKQSLTARFHYAIAKGARKELETIAEREPLTVGGKTTTVGVKEAERVTQSRMGAYRALYEAEHRTPGSWAASVPIVSGIVTGILTGTRGSSLPEDFRNGVVAWLVAQGLTSPKGLSRTGLVLTSATASRLFRQFPRLHMGVIETLTRDYEHPEQAAAPAPAPIPRQAGGPVQPGRPYLVGEAGPEVIVPSESGTVIPHQGGGDQGGLAALAHAVRTAAATGGNPLMVLLSHPLGQKLVAALTQSGKGKGNGKKPETKPEPERSDVSPWLQRLITILSQLPPAQEHPGLGLVPGRQQGGPVEAGQPYRVGEQGSETVVPDPLTALRKAQTIGASQIGERYVPTEGPQSLQDLILHTGLRPLPPLLGARRPGSVAAQDPYGILGWLRGAGQMPAMLGMMAGPEEQLAIAARRNPGLDMSDAARMLRAIQQGKTLEVFRGTVSPRDYRTLRSAVNPENEFGIHAGSDRQTAEWFINPGNPQSRILDLLANPGQILETPDIGSFKNPRNWIRKLGHQLDPQHQAQFAERYPEPTDPETLRAIIDLAHQHTPQTDLWGYPTPGSPALAPGDWERNYVGFQTALRNLLLGRGYQTLKYPNFVEGGGAPSYLFLDPRQLRSIYAAFNPEKLGSAHLLDSILAALALGGAGAAGAAGTGAARGARATSPTATTPTTRSQ